MTEPSNDLRRAIAADLSPVTPLRSPLVRSLLVLPLGALLIAQVLALGLRRDAPHVGFLLLWGASGVQALAGLFLIAASLKEAVPGRTLARTGAALLALAAAWTVALTFLTWGASATHVPPGHWNHYWRVCYRDPIVLGLPLLALALLLAWRAFPLRPGLAGGLAGMGAGLVSDAAWRTFCEVSDPRHVFVAHLAAVVTLALLGALAGALLGRARN